MSYDTFKSCLKIVLQLEGGYANDPDDPGGETACGITRRVAVENGYTGDMKLIPMSVVETIYHDKYWFPSASKIDNQHVALLHFDDCVNCGVTQATRNIQRAVNWLLGSRAFITTDTSNGYAVTVDGAFGPLTCEAVNGVSSFDLIVGYKLERESFYRKIAVGSKAKFLPSWIRRLDVIFKNYQVHNGRTF